MTKTKKAVGSAGLIATIMGVVFYIFTPEQIDLKSNEVQCLMIFVLINELYSSFL